jgi:hypothetical protein
MPDPSRVLEICGEGKTDIGKFGAPGKSRSEPEPPTQGVLPVLVHKLCGEPTTMMVVRRQLPFLTQGKGLWQKVKFVKQAAHYNRSAGAIFVLDSEGNHAGVLAQLKKGRDSAYPDVPMAVGVAHPCIETWLLADPGAIATALKLTSPPSVPSQPEILPAPNKNRANNPKTVLAACSGRASVSSQEASHIAKAMTDLTILRQRCPLGFEPFAKEVEARIAPLFR